MMQGDTLLPSFPSLEPEEENSMTVQNHKRDSQSDNGGGGGVKKKRRSYSSVAQAWLETLSEAIQDSIINEDDSATISSPTPSTTQRKKRPRRNAFVLHIVDDVDDEADDSPRQPCPETPAT